MVECEHCGDDVHSVWRRRERDESMTHHSVSWICSRCHPDVSPRRDSTTAADAVAADGGEPR